MSSPKRQRDENSPTSQPSPKTPKHATDDPADNLDPTEWNKTGSNSPRGKLYITNPALPKPQTTPTKPPRTPTKNPSAEAAGSAIQSRRSSWSNNSGYDLPSPPRRVSRFLQASQATPTVRTLDELNQLLEDFDAEFNPPEDDEDGVEGLIQGGFSRRERAPSPNRCNQAGASRTESPCEQEQDE